MDIPTEIEDQERKDSEAIMEDQDNTFTFNYLENSNMNARENQDVEMTEPDEDEDRAKSEVCFNFKVENVSKIRETVLSPPKYCRNLPWKIMVMQRTNNSNPPDRQQKSLGFFLQCNGDTESSVWSCFASADLILMPQKTGIEPFVRKIQHLFYVKENDWGFSHFMSFSDLLDPEKGFVKDDSIILEVHVKADAPHGVSWDSKKHTGFVGLKNQGATCYMNSLLQTLYFTNQLRKAVYKMPTESDDSNKSVALALQRVFHELQFSDKPVGTKKLTKSFGWETLDSFMQHDVQEFLRVLLDKLEIKMKGTCVEGTVPKLFEGKMISFIKCKEVNYESSRTETFYDIQLNVKGKRDIIESFKDYVEAEVLDGDNKYDAGDYGLQDAVKGVIFETLPPVLHLHLMRFQYDPITDCSVKFNDRFEFYDTIELDDFLQNTGESPATYILHAVLVHSGDNHGGHYVVYINPKGDGKWCKFDDDVVSKCSKEEAVTNNFGGNDEDTNITVKHSTNAYMLVYIRKSEIGNVLEDVSPCDIPEELEDRLKEEKNMETIKRKERNEAHLYMTVNVILADSFEGYQGSDLCDQDKVTPRSFKVRKTITLLYLIEQIADTFGYSVEQIRIWPFEYRTNSTYRPSSLNTELDGNKAIIDIAGTSNPWVVWVETLSPESVQVELPPFDNNINSLLFFKVYDPKTKQLYYMGHKYVSAEDSIESLTKEINQKAGYPLDTKLIVYEEIQANLCKQLSTSEANFLHNMLDGSILIFQKDISDSQQNYDLPTAFDYFQDLFHRVEVTFCDKLIPLDQGFTLELSQKISYDDLVATIAQQLGTDKKLLQIFKNQPFKDIPGAPLPYNYEGSLKDILPSNKPNKTNKKIHYQQLSIPANELANKRSCRISWLGAKSKEEKELTMYVNKDATIGQFLEEAKKDNNIELVGPDQGGSGKLRLLEISSSKISQELDHSLGVDILTNTSKVYRLEEIPSDELNLEDDELLVPVAHYHKEVYSTFGIPFFLKVKNGEKFSKVKERLAKKLNIQEKEFEKFKFAIVTQSPNPIKEENDFMVNVNLFKVNNGNQDIKAWLGLDHLNKAPKRSRLNYMEKSIKIYN